MRPPDSSSRLVGRYNMYGQIAAGGMASVHLGRLTGPAGFSRTVAIKCPHPHYAKDPEFVAMFLDEARLAARVNHPNVIAMLDVVMTGEELFLVMEYVLGVSFAHVLRRVASRGERLAPALTSSIVGDMLRGLNAAHDAKGVTGESLNIVHRDVSPQNVLVGVDGVSRLLDFGVAKAVGRLQTTRDGKIKGKLSYMAPEQISGQRVSRRADVYSASVVLWQALTGRRLFGDDGENAPRGADWDEPDIIGKVLFGRVPAPSELVPGLPPGLDEAVMRGLERDPAKRYETALHMVRELHRCVPPAPPVEVAATIRAIAGKEIDEASTRISNIERSEAEVQATVEVPVSVAEPHTTPEGRSAVAVAASVTLPQRALARSRWGHARGWVPLVASGAAVGVLGLGLLAWRVASPVNRVSSPEMPVASVPAPSLETRPDSPAPAPSTFPAAGGATSAASPAAPAAPSSRTSAAGHVPAAPRSSPGNCPIVWRADAAGILHPIRECK